jgi:hypothetical protein
VKSLSFLFAIAFIVGSSALSAAESHHVIGGSFCTAKGYLAYDDSQADPNYRLIAHWLRIVRFGTEGIYSGGAVNLPIDFGWPWMICEDDHVELAGPRHYPYFKKCVVKIEGKAMIKGSAECYDDSIENLPKFGGEPDSLSAFGPDEPPIQLESSDPDHMYELLRHSSNRRIGSAIEWHEQSEIVQLDSKGTILKRLPIWEDSHLEYLTE